MTLDTMPRHIMLQDEGGPTPSGWPTLPVGDTRGTSTAQVPTKSRVKPKRVSKPQVKPSSGSSHTYGEHSVASNPGDRVLEFPEGLTLDPTRPGDAMAAIANAIKRSKVEVLPEDLIHYFNLSQEQARAILTAVSVAPSAAIDWAKDRVNDEASSRLAELKSNGVTSTREAYRQIRKEAPDMARKLLDDAKNKWPASALRYKAKTYWNNHKGTISAVGGGTALAALALWFLHRRNKKRPGGYARLLESMHLKKKAMHSLSIGETYPGGIEMNKTAECKRALLTLVKQARGMQKRAQSMEERYPNSIAYKNSILEAMRNGEVNDNYDRAIASMTPEEISAITALTGPVYPRGAGGSIDQLPHFPGYEFMRDPRFMDPSQHLTPAGTNLINSIAGDDVDWKTVDRTTGAGQGFNGKNIPFPPGFLHDTAPTNSTMKVKVPGKRRWESR